MLTRVAPLPAARAAPAVQTGDGSYAFWRAINVVCHEMAHQWWGNVAGPADWRQLSLIEGIASYLEYNCTEKGLAALLDNGLGGDANVTIAEGTVAAAMFFRCARGGRGRKARAAPCRAAAGAAAGAAATLEAMLQRICSGSVVGQGALSTVC